MRFNVTMFLTLLAIAGILIMVDSWLIGMLFFSGSIYFLLQIFYTDDAEDEGTD